MEVQIKLYDKREMCLTTMYVEQLAANRFKMIENDVLNCRLTLGTEFETRINKDGEHEIIRIIKASDFITRRFLLPANYNVNDYRMLGDELVALGGFWQVDFGGFLTVNLPKDFQYDVDLIIKELQLKLIEVV